MPCIYNGPKPIPELAYVLRDIVTEAVGEFFTYRLLCHERLYDDASAEAVGFSFGQTEYPFLLLTSQRIFLGSLPDHRVLQVSRHELHEDVEALISTWARQRGRLIG